MTFVADTGAIVALLDRSEASHRILAKLFDDTGDQWVIPSFTLPEIDYLVGSRLSQKVRRAFLEDVRDSAFNVVAVTSADLKRAIEIDSLYANLNLGIVDAAVIALAERLRAEAIITLDVKHFGAVRPQRPIRILPGDS